MLWTISAHISRSGSVSHLIAWKAGSARENLNYEVRSVPVQAKYGEVLRLLQDALREDGGAIVFCARQKTVEELGSIPKRGWTGLRPFPWRYAAH